MRCVRADTRRKTRADGTVSREKAEEFAGETEGVAGGSGKQKGEERSEGRRGGKREKRAVGTNEEVEEEKGRGKEAIFPISFFFAIVCVSRLSIFFLSAST
jgi:hypothetical protein